MALEHIQQLFDEALTRRPDERTAFVESRHGADPELVQRLLRLLAAHERAERDEDARSFGFVDGLAEPLEPIPERIGPYRIRERLGEGGMGVVYAAEQSEPLRRRVAIKVIKLGMDTREVLARFEAERQALALLDHRGVAKALDAGVTDRGRPYFVMELVKGLPLTDYCRSNALSLPDRLRLFVDVCAAIQHAHQKGIIHRDLKPSNILVTVHEGQPVPKVIDFGVAKATTTRLTERTLFTEQGRLIGTPEYMSPEQAEMSGLDVDTRTDVYSLGVILYELLTGALPFDSQQLRSGGPAEVLRIVREIQPPKPSTRLAELARRADSGRDDLEQRSRRVRGELDWIVMRAIEKDRTRRYGTASSLAEDVERFLADHPVQARPQSVLYALRKLVKRHRVAAALALVVLLSAIGGASGLLIGMIRAREAEDLAMQRADNAQATAGFLERILFQVDPESGSRDPSLLEAMERAGQLAEVELRRFPEVEAAIRESLGVAYRRRSMFVEAAPQLWRSLEIRRQLFGETDLATAASCVALANLRFEYEGKLDATRELLDRAAQAYRQQRLNGTVADGWLQLDVGLVDLAGDRLAAAERAFATCQQLLVADRGAQHQDISRPLRGLAQVALASGDAATAEQLAREAVALCENRPATYIGARARLVLAEVLLATERGDEALKLVDQARAQFLRQLGDQHIRIAECHALRARVALHRGDAPTAIAEAERCEAMRRKMLYEDHWEILEARTLQQRAQVAAGVSPGDLAIVERELAAIEIDAVRHLGADHPLVIDVVVARADCAAARNDQAAQQQHAQRAAGLRASRAERLRRAAGD